MPHNTPHCQPDAYCQPDDDLDDAPEYEWRCFGTIVCDPLTDQHGQECDRINQEAREEFYAEVVRSTTLGSLL